MFEYNGMTFTLDQLEEKARSKGVTLQEYLASNPEITEIAQEKPEVEEVKTEAVVEGVADTTAMNEQIATGQSTDLGSEDISLDLEKINNISQNFQQEDVVEGITTDQQPLDVLEQEDLGLYIDDLIKTRKNYLKTEEEENKVETEIVETFANLTANLLNLPTSLKSNIQDILAASVLTGKDILEPIVGEREVLTDLWLDLMENSQKTKEEMLDVSVNIYGDDKDKGSKFIEGVRTGDVSDMVGGAVTGMTSIVTTMVPAILTGGASLVPQIVGPIISDYNIEKANALFPESDNPLEELENSGETEVLIPLTLGTMAAGLEFVGFKGISKSITKSAFNYKGLVSLFWAGSGEGATEVGQLGIETTSNALARGEDKVDAAIEGLNAMASDQGAEAFALGFIGAVTFGGAGQVRQANAYRALRNDSNGVKIFNSSIKQMGDIKREMKMSKSKPYQEALQVELQEVENDLKTYLENNQKILNFLTVEQKQIDEVGSFPNVFIAEDKMAGDWRKNYFKTSEDSILVLELGCGAGEYTLEMAEHFPDKNFIGADKKGDRIWRASKKALRSEFQTGTNSDFNKESLKNVAFIRTLAEKIEHFFKENEVDEIWVTFPDPHSKPCRSQKHLTSERFLNIYKKILKPGGCVHLKTDNTNLFEFSLQTLKVPPTDVTFP